MTELSDNDEHFAKLVIADLTGDPLPEATQRWLTTAAARCFVSGDDFQTLLGVKSSRNRILRKTRDDYIRHAVDLMDGSSLSARCEQFLHALVAYQCSVWQSNPEQLPDCPDGPLPLLLHNILKFEQQGIPVPEFGTVRNICLSRNS